MAEKRMLTKKITDDDHFQNLSSSAQALYLHLTLSADDDGFCNQVNASMFKAHASVQDLEALLSARYLLQFESGVIVIKHWRMANALRKDRYTPTVFQEELARLKIKENGAYTERDDTVAAWLPNGCQMVATDKDSIDKNRLDKNNASHSEKPRTKKFVPPTLEEVEAYCKERNSPVDPKTFYEYFTADPDRQWIDSKGNPVRNWKSKIITWESREPKPKEKLGAKRLSEEDVDPDELKRLQEKMKKWWGDDEAAV